MVFQMHRMRYVNMGGRLLPRPGHELLAFLRFSEAQHLAPLCCEPRQAGAQRERHPKLKRQKDKT